MLREKTEITTRILFWMREETESFFHGPLSKILKPQHSQQKKTSFMHFQDLLKLFTLDVKIYLLLFSSRNNQNRISLYIILNSFRQYSVNEQNWRAMALHGWNQKKLERNINISEMVFLISIHTLLIYALRSLKKT